MGLQRCMREHTSTEFLDWVWFLDKEEWQKHHREDYYMAQIAAEVARPNRKNPKAVKTEDFLLKFGTRVVPKPLSPDELAQRISESKAKWIALTSGVGGEKRRQGATGGPKRGKPGAGGG